MTGLFLPARRLATAAFLLVLLAAPAWAQLTTATVNGTVTDPSGAAIPGAEIIVKNVETGITRNTLSGETGRYQVPNLQPGSLRDQRVLARLPDQRAQRSHAVRRPECSGRPYAPGRRPGHHGGGHWRSARGRDHDGNGDFPCG